MKQICIYIALACLGGYSLGAQTSLPQGLGVSSPIAVHLYDASVHHVGLPRQFSLPSVYALAEQRPYLDALAQLLGEKRSDAEVLDAFIQRYPASVDRFRSRLMLVLLYWERADWDSAYGHLDLIEREGLSDTESSLYYLLCAHRLLSGSLPTDQAVRQAEPLLVLATETDNEWSERALLTLVSLRWYRGERAEAESILGQTRWSESLLPEVAYLKSLIAFEGQNLSMAIAQAQQSMSQYPVLRSRARLYGAMGQAYYALQDYSGAMSALERAEGLDRLTPYEAFSYGMVLYRAADYTRALPQLMQASHAEGAVGLMAQYHLASCYVFTDQHNKAQLIYTALINHPEASLEIREASHYQSIEVGHAGRGSDAFGQTLQRIEQFLQRYPKSKHYPRVWALLSEYLTASKQYEQSLNLLDRLGVSGAESSVLRQEILLSWALSMDKGDALYLRKLDEAIALGARSRAYSTALHERSMSYLASGDYTKALEDARRAGQQTWPEEETEQKLRSQYLQGYALYNLKRYAEASTALQSALTWAKEPSLRADILCRLGDCSLAAGGGYASALRLYERSADELPSQASEALQRMARLYGLQGDWQRQITTLDRLIADYPQSNILPSVLYDKGRALLTGAKDSEAARRVFAQIEQQYPTSLEAPTAALEQALILSNAGRAQQAIDSYKSLVSRYPNSPEAESALQDLRALYADADRSDEYLAYSRSLPTHLRPNGTQELRLNYQSLESRIRRGAAADEELEGFVRDFESSAEAHRIENVLLQRYREQKAWSKGIAYLEGRRASLSDAARRESLGLSLIEFYRFGAEHNKALALANELYKGSSQGGETRRTAALHAVRLSNELEKYQEANSLATELLKEADLPINLRHELTLSKGLAQEELKAFKGAIATYTSIEKDEDTAYRAEAIVRRAGLHLRLKEAQRCVDVLEQFVIEGSQHSYWLARAFILLADANHILGNTYLSEQYIESLKENYKGEEADIWQMITKSEEKYKQKK